MSETYNERRELSEEIWEVYSLHLQGTYSEEEAVERLGEEVWSCLRSKEELYEFLTENTPRQRVGTKNVRDPMLDE